MSNFYPCATELALKYHMNRIRRWIVRTVFGPAKSEAPGDGLVREDHPDWREAR